MTRGTVLAPGPSWALYYTGPEHWRKLGILPPHNCLPCLLLADHKASKPVPAVAERCLSPAQKVPLPLPLPSAPQLMLVGASVLRVWGLWRCSLSVLPCCRLTGHWLLNARVVVPRVRSNSGCEGRKRLSAIWGLLCHGHLARAIF